MPKIVLAIRRLAHRTGGAERVLVDVANELARRGISVEIWHHERDMGDAHFPLQSSTPVVNTFPQRLRILRSFGRTLRVLGPLRFIPPISLINWALEHTGDIGVFRKRLRASAPDLVVAFQPNSFTDFLLAARGTGVPLIASLHNVPKEEFENPRRWDPNPVDRFLRRRMLGHAAAVTVLLPEFKEQMPAEVQDRTWVIPNIVTAGLAARELLQPRAKRILTLGRLAAAKDHATLIRAVALFPPEVCDWKVRIRGEGPLHKELRRLVRELELEDRIEILSPVTDVAPEYATASIFCMPSIHEGFGLATAEALQAGLPAVGFADCPGTNRLIRHGENGLLVQGSDRAQALADALVSLMRDAQLRERLSAAGPASVEEYSPERVGDRWVALIEHVLGSQSPGSNLTP